MLPQAYFCKILQLSNSLKTKQIPTGFFKVLSYPPDSTNLFLNTTRELLQSACIAMVRNETVIIASQSTHNIST